MATHCSILAGESHGQRNLAGYSPWGRKESDTTERLLKKENSLGRLLGGKEKQLAISDKNLNKRLCDHLQWSEKGFFFFFSSMFRPRCTARGILVPRPGIEPLPSALEGEVLTTGPLEKSQASFGSGCKVAPSFTKQKPQ